MNPSSSFFSCDHDPRGYLRFQHVALNPFLVAIAITLSCSFSHLLSLFLYILIGHLFSLTIPLTIFFSLCFCLSHSHINAHSLSITLFLSLSLFLYISLSYKQTYIHKHYLHFSYRTEIMRIPFSPPSSVIMSLVFILIFGVVLWTDTKALSQKFKLW